jgi:hypothetical protein
MTRLDRASTMVLVGAGLWGAALLAAAFLLPSGNAGPAVSPTLVQENGLKVLLPTGLPLLSVVLVAGALARRRARGRWGAGPLALGATIVTGALCLLGALTVGPFVVPVAVLLAVACSLAPRRPLTGLAVTPGGGA